MSILLEILVWMTWVGGVAAGIVVLAFAFVGATFLYALKDFFKNFPFG